MPIKELPQTAVRALRSGQAIADSASVVKELIDNSIDAGSTSIWIEVPPNLLDIIQVRHNGSGIPSIDRPLVAKRYCTSELTSSDERRHVGGKSLGFRGEALSYVVDLSSKVTITTRVDGEDLGTILTIARDGRQ